MERASALDPEYWEFESPYRHMEVVIKSCRCTEYKEMYVDGEMVLCGDYYHNKISAQIEGFKEALNFLKIQFKVTDLGENSIECKFGC